MRQGLKGRLRHAGLHLPVSLCHEPGRRLRLIEDAQADVCFRLDLKRAPELGVAATRRRGGALTPNIEERAGCLFPTQDLSDGG